MQNNLPIGVMDSGLGGFSVVLAMKDRLPCEDIVYFGDTANCPYGNKSARELLHLGTRTVSFLEDQGVKCIAVACNTTSALADDLRRQHSTPLITVAECAADAIGAMKLPSVGLIATVSTVNSGIYEKRIHAADPSVVFYSVGSRQLAELVEKNAPDAQLDREIRHCLDPMIEESGLRHVILGCTHYPLVQHRFASLYPGVNFLDPAPLQADCLKTFLRENTAQCPEHKPCLTVCTTGDPDIFEAFCQKHGLHEHYTLRCRRVSI